MTALKNVLGGLAVLAGATAVDAGVTPVDNVFTYQGQLRNASGPIDGTASVRFRLFNQEMGGGQQGVTLTKCGLTLVDGLFTVDLDFGTNVFDGSERWLEISVQSPAGDCVNFTTLSPRQQLTPTPYAIRSLAPWETNGSFIFYNAGSVGIGTNTPDTLLEVAAGNAVARVSSTAVDGSSFLELKGDAPSGIGGNVLGAIRFLDETNSERAALSSAVGFFANPFNFVVDGTTQMALGSTGNLGVGTALPLAKLQIVGGTDSEPDGGGFAVFGATNEANLSIDNNEIMARSNGLASDLFLNNDGGSVITGGHVEINAGGLGVNTPSAGTYFNVTEANGILILFLNAGISAGGISVFGSEVVYSTFTGAHNASTDEVIEPGTLVMLTGQVARDREGPYCEPTYGVAPTSIANDPRVMGTYLAPPDAMDPNGRHLVAAVGNGEMWVVDSGAGDIEPGDALISSELRGCAMQDDPVRFTVGHVVARAAEPVNWAKVKPQADGSKRVLLSIFYDNFERQGDAEAIAARMDELASENATLKARLDALEQRLENVARLGQRGRR